MKKYTFEMQDAWGKDYVLVVEATSEKASMSIANTCDDDAVAGKRIGIEPSAKRMKLSEAEKKLVMEHRAKIKRAKDIEAKQKICEHDWRFSCVCHNDSAYDCIKCGAVKWE